MERKFGESLYDENDNRLNRGPIICGWFLA